MLIQRCIVVLAIFLCHTEAHPNRSTTVDCEKYPYHHACRGMMTRKRFVLPDCNSGTDPDCPVYRSFFVNLGRSPQHPSAKSKLWMSLLGEASQRENTYGSYPMKYATSHEKKKIEDAPMQYEDRRIPKDFWQEPESAENDY